MEDKYATRFSMDYSNKTLDGSQFIKMVRAKNEEYELIEDFNIWQEHERDINWIATVTNPLYPYSNKKKELLQFKNYIEAHAHKSYELDSLSCMAICVALEVVLDKLMIIGKLDYLPEPVKVITYKTLDERFGNERKDEISFQFNKEDNYDDITLQLNVFQKNRTYIELIMNELYEELLVNSTFYSLVKQVSQCEQMKYEEDKLIQIETKNQTYLKNLFYTSEYEKSLTTYGILMANEEVQKITDGFEDEDLLLKVTLKYTDSWENSRNEQNTFRIKMTFEEMQKEIEKTILNTKREDRIHNEIARALLCITNEYEESTRLWEEKYSNDLEAKELAISTLKEMREVQMERLEKLQELYFIHREEMEEYKMIREQRIQNKVDKARRHLAAWKIQRWWRWILLTKPRKRKGVTKAVKKLKQKLKKKLNQ